MASDLPSLKKNAINLGSLSTFKWRDLCNLEEIGRGSYGCVYIAQHPQRHGKVVIKKLLRQHNQEIKLFVKEAKILSAVHHKHIVKLHAVCPSPVAIMMEYEYFDFSPFGTDLKVNSLQDFLDAVYSEEGVGNGFAKIHVKIATDIALGLQHLHNNDIVHRDLKPSNILVSNKHYCNFSSKSEIAAAWKKEAIVCKLVDFGESRSILQQTATLAHTVTNNVKERGTLIYNAPEIVLADDTATLMTLEDLKKCDIWAAGMTFFMLCNPDLTIPYELEIKEKKGKTVEALKAELLNKLSSQSKPLFSTRHSTLQATEWLQIEAAYEECTDFEPHSRPSADDVVKLLQKKHQTCCDYNLSVSQNTAVATHDSFIAAGAAVSQGIPNDGTNSCSLLAVVIADRILKQEIKLPNSEGGGDAWLEVVNMIDDVILEAPSQFNAFRSTAKFYDALEAYSILEKAAILKSKYEMFEELLELEEQIVFTRKARIALVNAVSKLGKGSEVTKIAIYSCGGYSFIIGGCSQQNLLFLIDTHPISHKLGGNGCGILKVCYADDAHQLCTWIWRRLQQSGVKGSSMQTFSLMVSVVYTKRKYNTGCITTNCNDMLSYSLTTMMFFLTKE